MNGRFTGVVSHLAENFRAGKAPKGAPAAGRALTMPCAIGIPVARGLGQAFERRAFEVRKLRATRPPPVPARDPKRAIHVLLG